ncbi:hypothetical protein R4K55_11750 [Brachyspira alvinipulli]|uniref:hypothetical protein n=1 Tax=Brachyspira alvinipulli TaxID=84379 RepID=UPI003003D78E
MSALLFIIFSFIVHKIGLKIKGNISNRIIYYIADIVIFILIMFLLYNYFLFENGFIGKIVNIIPFHIGFLSILDKLFIYLYNIVDGLIGFFINLNDNKRLILENSEYRKMFMIELGLIIFSILIIFRTKMIRKKIKNYYSDTSPALYIIESEIRKNLILNNMLKISKFIIFIITIFYIK